MSLKFTGRDSQLTEIENLVKAKQGAVFAVSGNAGMGKSTLLKEVARRYPKTGQVFIDINDVPPLQTATEFLQFFAKQAKRLEHTKKALAEINGTYKTTADLISPYQELFKETLKQGSEAQAEEQDLTDEEKQKVANIAELAWKTGNAIWQSIKESKKEKLSDPELYLLKAIRQDCKQQPLIFIDTYERLQAAQELSQQQIKSLYSKSNERLSPVSKTLSLQDWLERFIEFLTTHGAIVLIAGRHIPRRDWQPQKLEHFTDDEILDVVGRSNYVDLQALLVKSETKQALLNLLKRLSFDGIPLWLQLVLNFVADELSKESDIVALAKRSDIETLFAAPKLGSNWESENIDHAACKLALFKRVFQHNLELGEQAWKMALPRRLDKPILQILFAAQAQVICEAFVKAGLLPSMRWEEGKLVNLHQEIRDLLLAYAEHSNWLELDETKNLHQQLAELFSRRYQKNAELQSLLEQLYHQVITNENIGLDHVKQPEILFEMALAFKSEKQYLKMSPIILRLIEIQPDYKDAWYNLGVSLRNSGKPNEAIVAFHQQIEIEPLHGQAWNSLGNALSDLGELDKAIATYQKQIEIEPSHDLAWNNLGNALSDQGKLDEAIVAYQKQLEIKPNDEWAWYNLGNAFYKSGKLDEAIVAYQKQLEIKPNHEGAWNNLGNALSDQGKLDEAIAAYQKQLEIKPNHEGAWNNLGNALSDQGKLDEAIAAYQKQLEIKPNHEWAWNNLGNALSDQGKLDEAIAAYQKQLEIKPNDEWAWYNLWNALSDQGKLDEAIVAYQKQLEIKPNDEWAWYNLGNAFYKSGKLDEAIVAYQKQLEIKPNHEGAWYNLWNALSDQGKLDEAIVAYQKQLEIKPNDEWAWYNLGNAFYKSGKLDEAIVAYQKQLEIKPNHEGAWNNLVVVLDDLRCLGATYLRQGNLEQAEKTFTRALETNPKNILILSNDAELALIQQDKNRCLQRINQTSPLVDNKNEIFAILPFLAWLAEPEQPLDALYQAIVQLDKDVKITWDFTDTEPAILRLTPVQKTIARQFIAYFQGKTTELPHPANENQEL